VTVDELCKGHPEEFREFMNYCRKLQFAEDPDYKFVLGLFEGCMKKNGWDPKVPDFIWNKNRLVLEKEALKQNLMKVISKPIKKLEAEEGGAAGAADEQKKKLEKNSITVSVSKFYARIMVNIKNRMLSPRLLQEKASLLGLRINSEMLRISKLLELPMSEWVYLFMQLASHIICRLDKDISLIPLNRDLPV
jgi:hypothetical protein